MLKTVTSLLTAACVFVHAVMGCCVHHAHAGEACSGHVEEQREHEAHDADSHEGHSHASHESESAHHSEPAHGEDCSCDECSQDDLIQLVVSNCSHERGHQPHFPCEGESCNWVSNQDQTNPLLTFDWFFAATIHCCDLASTPSFAERDCLNRQRIAPDRLSSALRVHALDQVWRL